MEPLLSILSNLKLFFTTGIALSLSEESLITPKDVEYTIDKRFWARTSKRGKIMSMYC